MLSDSGVFSMRLGKAHMKRICSLLLITVLLLFVPGCRHDSLGAVTSSFIGVPFAQDAKKKEHAHTDLCFEELCDDAPDLELEIQRMRELLFRIGKGEIGGKEAQRVLDERIKAFIRLRTAASIAHVRYCADTCSEENKAAYERLSNGIDSLACLLIDAQLLLSVDPSLSSRYDPQTVERLRQEDALNDPSVQPLTTRERELIGEYDALEQMTVSSDGRNWTREQILSDPSLSYNAFSALYKAYRSAYNERAGRIFLDLIETRKQTAETLGFDSYPAYGYALYGRDYSPEDARLLAQTVKRELVPVFLEMLDSFYESNVRLSCGTFREQPTLRRVETVIQTLMPELQTPWEYMFSHGMYGFESSGNRMPGSFTAYFEAYGAPFLFTSWDDSHEMPTTLLHEFGHYAGYYWNGVQRMESQDPLDLAEIDSQGLELLSISQYDILYGALSDAAKQYSLTLALYAVITGCMEDEFQQFAYRADRVSVDALNAEYERLSKEYGLSEMGLSGESWTEISHTFRAPMYYISYATSMLCALQLYLRDGVDHDGAIESYRTILMRPSGATFRSMLKEAGLEDPFDPDAVSALAERIRSLCRE